jgi:thioredoxin reductase (NADPH)
MPKVSDAVIIGAGPAGIAASIYLKRAGIEAVLIEKGETGGLLRSANLVENYPGFPGGISGAKLVSLFKEQMEALGISPVEALAESVKTLKGGFRIDTDHGTFYSRNVLVGTGTRPKEMRLEGADGPAGKRITYDVNALPGKGRVLIIGGGDAAFDYALNLDSRGRETIIITRSKPRCLRLLSDRVKKEKITVAVGCAPLSVKMNEGRIELFCRSGERTRTFDGDLMLMAVGRVPNTEILDGAAKGVKVKGRGPETNVPGVYAIGDVLGGSYRQTGIAVGSGVLAAMMVEDSVRGDEE